MINVGIVGVGFMGMIHYLSYQKVRGIKVKALCEKGYTNRLTGDWRDIKGNFGPPGTKMDLSGVDTYTEFDEMLDDKSIDLIDITLPPGLHAPIACKALQAGKHVFSEKPMSLTTAGCRQMQRAAEKADRMLMVGHVLPFFPEYAKARQIIESGRYGKLLGGSFKRVISDPLWLPDFYNPDRIGGPMLDLHIHDAHFIRLLFGMPKSVSSQGRMRGEVVEYFHSQFQFEDPSIVVSATSGVINQPGRGFTHAFEIHLEKATLLMDFAVIDDEPCQLMPLTVLPHKGKANRPALGDGDPVHAFAAEIKEVARCVKSGETSAILGSDLARDAIILCHKQTESVRKRKPQRITTPG